MDKFKIRQTQFHNIRANSQIQVDIFSYVCKKEKKKIEKQHYIFYGESLDISHVKRYNLFAILGVDRRTVTCLPENRIVGSYLRGKK